MSNDTPGTVVEATEGTCPVCQWQTLHRHTLAAVTAAAGHTRDAHPDIAAQRYFFPEDAWQRIPADWNFATVNAVIAPTAGQLALFAND